MPYRMEDLIGKITCADCLGVLRDLPDKCVDLVVTDCPYKIVSGGLSGNNKYGSTLYNHDLLASGTLFRHNDIEFNEWLPDIYRVLKDNTHCYIMINGRNLAQLQICAENAGFVFQNLLVWKKNNAGPNKWYMNTCEFILMLRKGGAKHINNRGDKNIFEIKNPVGHKLHPTEKPVELMERLIINSTQENELVLDPFSGSSPVALAAQQANRRFICVEKDPEYHSVSVKRLKERSKQQTLF